MELNLATTSQNRSHAVMSQRHEPNDSRDDFPTPPWATRALIENDIGQRYDLKSQSCLEPACGRGDMAKVLTGRFKLVEASDVHAYGYGMVRDFLKPSADKETFDWVITNPPFRHALAFVEKALQIARVGVAVLVRTSFLESKSRYRKLFERNAPTRVLQFVERVPMLKERLDPRASTATSYCWLVWEHGSAGPTVLDWIEPCRERLEVPGDYDGYDRQQD